MTPDIVEQAATGRAKCRACGEPIQKGALRFGERVPNAFGEGESTHWYHLACAAERRPDKLGGALEVFADDVPEREHLVQVAQEGRTNPKLASVRRAERSPSGRARCQHCHETIDKDSWRIAFERDPEPMAMANVSYVHLSCGPAYFGKQGLAEKLLRLSERLTQGDIDAAWTS